MKQKNIIYAVALFCMSILTISCASNKKVGCYYGVEEAQEVPTEVKEKTTAYHIAD